MKIDPQQAIRRSAALLRERGVPEDHAALQAQVLVDAELKGHPSHGLQRLPRILRRLEHGLIRPGTEGAAHWRSDAVLEVDGQCGLGPVVALAALRQIEQRVQATGVAVAAIRNSNHLGMLAWYVEHAAAHGLIGAAMSTSEALVHPHGGTRAMLGTNPLAIAVPTASHPLVLDLATSIVSMGKVHHHAATGRALAPGWARDAEGRATTDANLARHGSLAPFGEAKGYGLGIALELLVASLAGSALAPDVRGTLDAEFVCNKGDVLMVMRPAAAPGLADRLGTYLDAVRASPRAEPGQPVRVPGDGARHRRERAAREGFDIDPALWAELQALGDSANSIQEGLTT